MWHYGEDMIQLRCECHTESQGTRGDEIEKKTCTTYLAEVVPTLDPDRLLFSTGTSSCCPIVRRRCSLCVRGLSGRGTSCRLRVIFVVLWGQVLVTKWCLSGDKKNFHKNYYLRISWLMPAFRCLPGALSSLTNKCACGYETARRAANDNRPDLVVNVVYVSVFIVSFTPN